MSKAWLVFNIAIFVLSFLGGYASLSPEHIRQSNPDLTLCLLTVMTIPIASIGGIQYSIRRLGVTVLHTPSWSRNSLRIWYDPLQLLFVATFLSLAATAGSGLRLWFAGSAALWIFGLYCSMAIGLLIARMLANHIFRDRIVKS